MAQAGLLGTGMPMGILGGASPAYGVLGPMVAGPVRQTVSQPSLFARLFDPSFLADTEGLNRLAQVPGHFAFRMLPQMAGAAVNAAALPGDVYAGRVDPLSDEGIGRATDLAGLVTLGSGVVPAKPNTLRAGAKIGKEKPALPMDEASRVARAKEMGFRPDMPIAYSTAPAGEKVGAAAVQMLDGTVFTGSPLHVNAIEEAAKVLGLAEDDVWSQIASTGFVTTGGRYIARPEAGWIAERMAQGKVKTPWVGLAAEHVQLAGKRPPTDSVRTGATAPGLPGGQGVWGVAEGAAPPGSQSLWHRTARPRSFDARGLSQEEIEATLAQAWDEGSDAVMIKNYTRSGSKTPENIIVVRDPAQLRSPAAAFDPAKKFSPDLLAAGGPGGIAPGMAATMPNDREKSLPDILAEALKNR